MLSPIIEYLLALKTVSGPLCYPTRWQWALNVLPPGADVRFSVGPPSTNYAAIKYATSYSDDIIPSTVYLNAGVAGNTFFTGMVEEDWSREYLPLLVLFTQKIPMFIQIQNLSQLNQRFVSTLWCLIIPSEDDLDLVLEHIAAFSAVNSNALAKESIALLRAISQGKVLPAPIGGT